MSGKYDEYVHHPPHLRLSMKSDGSTVFDGLIIGHKQLGFPFMIGHQFSKQAFQGRQPLPHPQTSTSSWLGTEATRTTPTISVPRWSSTWGRRWRSTSQSGPRWCTYHQYFPCPLEVTRVGSPIIQIEVMLAGDEGKREPYFEADKDFDPFKVMDFQTIPYGK